MTGFEPLISGVGSDRYTNCATTASLFFDKFNQGVFIMLYLKKVTLRFFSIKCNSLVGSFPSSSKEYPSLVCSFHALS